MPASPDRYEPLPSLLELPSWLLRKLPRRRRRLVEAALGALLVALVAGAAVALPHIRADQRAQQAAQDRRDAAHRAALEARYAREARPHVGAGPAAPHAAAGPRHALVGDLQAAVLADAQARARRGELPGGYRATTCFRYPKQLDERPPAAGTAPAVVVECLAVTRDVAASSGVTVGSLIGQPYRARLDFARGRFAFCKIVQQPGELSIHRAPVLRIPAACGGSAH